MIISLKQNLDAVAARRIADDARIALDFRGPLGPAGGARHRPRRSRASIAGRRGDKWLTCNSGNARMVRARHDIAGGCAQAGWHGAWSQRCPRRSRLRRHRHRSNPTRIPRRSSPVCPRSMRQPMLSQRPVPAPRRTCRRCAIAPTWPIRRCARAASSWKASARIPAEASPRPRCRRSPTRSSRNSRTDRPRPNWTSTSCSTWPRPSPRPTARPVSSSARPIFPRSPSAPTAGCGSRCSRAGWAT